MINAPVSFKTSLYLTHPSKPHLNRFRLGQYCASQFSGTDNHSNKPPQSKTPGWVKAVLLTGAGLIGIGQLPPLTLEKNEPTITAQKPISQEENKAPEASKTVLYSKDGVDVNYIDLGPSNEEIQSKEIQNQKLQTYKEGASPIGLFGIGVYIPNGELPLYRQAIRNICQNHTAKELTDLERLGWERLIKDEVSNLQCIAQAEAFNTKPNDKLNK